MFHVESSRAEWHCAELIRVKLHCDESNFVESYYVESTCVESHRAESHCVESNYFELHCVESNHDESLCVKLNCAERHCVGWNCADLHCVELIHVESHCVESNCVESHFAHIISKSYRIALAVSSYVLFMYQIVANALGFVSHQGIGDGDAHNIHRSSYLHVITQGCSEKKQRKLYNLIRDTNDSYIKHCCYTLICI